MKASLIFPHQLFHNHPAVKKNQLVFLVEDSLFFNDPIEQLKFHKQKIILHRSSMMAYADKLRKNKVQFIYWPYKEHSLADVFEHMRKKKVEEVTVVDPLEYILSHRLKHLANKHGIRLIILKNPNFLTDRGTILNFFSGKKDHSFSEFYIFQRKRLNLLIDKNGKPEGGKWSYDINNRKKLPKKIMIPKIFKSNESIYVKRARKYTEKYFSRNPGFANDFFYPVTRIEALKWLDDFLKHRLNQFGPYEDALNQNHSFIFHSILSPIMNIGLINPDEIVKKTLKYSRENNIPIESLEGFLRQVIGWREYVRGMYFIEGIQQRSTNFWKHKRKMPQSFWDGSTGLWPLDHMIKKVQKNAYAHHTERLMVLGNIMLLCELNPEDVYRWFMEMFIDAYDWVMVPNVYAMSQYADGGKMMTKPYISGANYLKKMSDYPGGEWEVVWTGLFWRFIHKHLTFFKKNPRLSAMTHQWEKMDKKTQKNHLKKANAFLKTLE